MTAGLGPKRQQRIAGTLSTSAFQAAAERGHGRVTVEPFNHTMIECLSLGLGPRKPTFKLTNARSLFEEDVPILGRPTVRAWLAASSRCLLCCGTGGRGWPRRLRGCLKQQVAAIYLDVDAGGTSDLESLCRNS